MKKSVITSSMLAVLLSGFLVTPISAYALERSKGTTEETVASETSLTEQQMSSGVTEEMNPSKFSRGNRNNFHFLNLRFHH